LFLLYYHVAAYQHLLHELIDSYLYTSTVPMHLHFKSIELSSVVPFSLWEDERTYSDLVPTVLDIEYRRCLCIRGRVVYLLNIIR
jgi:hypothetical protein